MGGHQNRRKYQRWSRKVARPLRSENGLYALGCYYLKKCRNAICRGNSPACFCPYTAEYSTKNACKDQMRANMQIVIISLGYCLASCAFFGLYLLTQSRCIARWHFGCIVHIMTYRHVRACIVAMSCRRLLYLLYSFCAFVRRFPRLHYFSASKRTTAHSKIKYDQSMDECNLNLHLQKSFKKNLRKS